MDHDDDHDGSSYSNNLQRPPNMAHPKSAHHRLQSRSLDVAADESQR